MIQELHVIGDYNPPFDVASTLTSRPISVLCTRECCLLTCRQMQAPGEGLYRPGTPAPQETNTQSFVGLSFTFVQADLAGLVLPGLAESDIYLSKTSQLEERLNGLVDLLRASGEFPTDDSRTRQSSSSQLEDEPGAYMCSTGLIYSAHADLEWH